MIEVYKFKPDAFTPTRNTPNDALDLYAYEDVFIPSGSTKPISTMISIHVGPGSTGKIEDRSSMALKGLRTGGGVVDAGYSGELKVILHNLNNTEHEGGYLVRRGDRIAQFLIYKVDTSGVMVVSNLWNSERGQSGLGSSGK